MTAPVAEPDPIAELWCALREGRPPPLAWVVRWSRGGGDPVAAAWAVAVHDQSMRELLDHARHPAMRGGDEDGWPETMICHIACIRPNCAPCVAAIRAAVPVPPTLAELLEAHRGQ